MSDGGTSWAEAAIAIGGITFVTMIACVTVWQLFGTWRAKISVAREEAYRKLAEDAAASQRRLAEAVERHAAELAGLRQSSQELERMLKEVA